MTPHNWFPFKVQCFNVWNCCAHQLQSDLLTFVLCHTEVGFFGPAKLEGKICQENERTNTQKRCPFLYRWLECKSRKSRNTWSNWQIWPWNMEWSRAKTNRVRVREESEEPGLKLSIQKIKIMASGPITSWQMKEKKWKQWQILFSWAPESLQMVTVAMKLKNACSLEGKLSQT